MARPESGDDRAGPGGPRKDHMGVSGPHRPVRRPQASGRPVRRARPGTPGCSPATGTRLTRRRYRARFAPPEGTLAPCTGDAPGGQGSCGLNPGKKRSIPADRSFSERLDEFHLRFPYARVPSNALLALPDDRLLYLAALLRDTPTPAPALSPEEWQHFLDLLRLHSVYPLLVYRLRSWPEDCRPPRDATD